jgi:hypothetical protein
MSLSKKSIKKSKFIKKREKEEEDGISIEAIINL